MIQKEKTEQKQENLHDVVKQTFNLNNKITWNHIYLTSNQKGNWGLSLLKMNSNTTAKSRSLRLFSVLKMNCTAALNHMPLSSSEHSAVSGIA